MIIVKSSLNIVTVAGGRMPTYLLEHLATFTVSPENDLVYPADGMRRLLAMEKTSGIWTQKVIVARVIEVEIISLS